MANTPKQLYANTPSTTSNTVYTVPASTTTIVKDITMVNTTATAATITISINGKNIISGYTINPNDTVSLPCSVVIPASQAITALQGTVNAVNLFISGVEVV
ncbi:hypothetical protein [Neobacillus niacini]|uniref:hypothetical protein n=1 Tax=Neobacillus niacini TaxID=86668 RepID=UPI002862B65B|nr:hypothetical protein [Neobacillus niacini]MDR7001550.1 hypothetical protein [Neobacillus niacini]